MADPLNYPDPGFPQAAETNIFRAFDQVLRNDSILSARVRTWVTFRGEDVDTIDVPSADQCPFLLMGPWPTSSDWATEKQHQMPLTIRLMLAVVGTNADHLMNFSAAIRAAFFPQNNPTLRDAIVDRIMTAGASRPAIKLSAFGVREDPDGAPLMIGEGTIQFSTLIGT